MSSPGCLKANEPRLFAIDLRLQLGDVLMRVPGRGEGERLPVVVDHEPLRATRAECADRVERGFDCGRNRRADVFWHGRGYAHGWPDVKHARWRLSTGKLVDRSRNRSQTPKDG